MWDDGKQLTECVEALRAVAARDVSERGLRGAIRRVEIVAFVAEDGGVTEAHLATDTRRAVSWGSSGIYEWTPDAGARRIA